ncbi:hypothetical protein CHCC4186_0530 [Bacillus paralicheniformis]|nr:hypothetical protein CHCC4186_0530 [Bacillus paralicheniformis]
MEFSNHYIGFFTGEIASLYCQIFNRADECFSISCRFQSHGLMVSAK